MRKYSGKGSWKHILLLIIPYLFIVGVFQYAGASISGIEDSEATLSNLNQLLVLNSFGFIGTFLVLYIFMRFVDEEPFVNLGFNFISKNSLVFIGFFLGLLTMLTGLLLLLLFGEIEILEYEFSGIKLFKTVLLFMTVAIAEEALFRGYVLRNLIGSFNKYLALVLSAILFAIMHGMNPSIDFIGVFNLFLAGVLLGLPYIFTRNLWFSIALHFSWNFFQSIFGFNVSGQSSYSILKIKLFDYNILNGGGFGLEGSVLMIVMQVIMIFGTYFYFERLRTFKK